MFVTLFCGVLDTRTGVMTCASGGHLSPVLVRPGAPARLVLGSLGTLVGAMAGLEFQEHEVPLLPGDTLVLYSDGVTEAFDASGATFGGERLLATLGARAAEPARDTAGGLLATVREFAVGVEQTDDIAIMAVRYVGQPATGAGTSRELRLQLAATPDDVGHALVALRRFCAAHAVPEPATDDLILALDEVLANVVDHGYGGDPQGLISVWIRRTGDAIEIDVRDRAPAYNPLDAPLPELDEPVETRAPGGLGVYLVRTVMDGMEYAREAGENRLRLTRRLARP